MSAHDDREVTYLDLVQARERRDPRFASLVIRYLEQPDPPENAPEEPPEATGSHGASDGESDDDARAGGDELSSGTSTPGTGSDDDDFDDGDDDDFDGGGPDLPPDAWTLGRLRTTLSPYNMYGKTPEERRALRREVWDALMAAPHPPPRLHLGALLVELYEAGDEWSRAALVHIIREARVGWGIWRGIKRIYKMVEERHDPEMFGILAWRLDAMSLTSTAYGEISGATFGYMRRRAWRYLRQLGQTLPEMYPHFAVQVLRHYPDGFRFYGSWIASQIWAHKDLVGARAAAIGEPPKKLSRRAFDEAWKISAEPLLRLLEDAHNDHVCGFAIRSLRADFPERLRDSDPSWLARIGKKRLASVHGFVVEVLSGSPELHQSRFQALGLHDMVVSLLGSSNDTAVAYAIEYATSHAPDIPVAELIELADSGGTKVQEFVKARLAKLEPAVLGLQVLVRMLAVDSLSKLAREKLDAGFQPGDLTAELYVALANGTGAQQEFVRAFYKSRKAKVPAAFLIAQLESPDLYYWQRSRVLEELGKRKAAEIGIEWIENAVLDPRFADEVSEWLTAGMLKGDDLDVEWVKGLIARPSRRALAIELLGNRKLVAPHKIGLSWLLAATRHADQRLAEFAHRYLLEHFEPDDFALDAGSTDPGAGIDRIWSLLDPHQAEPVRRFAASYLRVHHPDVGPTTDEARQLGIKPKLPRDSYSLARARPLFSDVSADVRRLARAIGRHELVRWGDRALVYQLAASRFREGRTLAAEALLHIGESDADPRLVPPVSWLEPARVFALAESPIKAAREIALTLVRRHYDVLGSAERLGWLMESPDREVRLFAVRLLWEKHRPLPLGVAEPATSAARRFDSAGALRLFLRTVLFGLPPGRMERRDGEGDALPDRPLPASVAKRRLVEVVRDMGMEDRGFAELAVPVLEEFMSSQAKGEWQGCVTALARLRRAHPGLETALPAAPA